MCPSLPLSTYSDFLISVVVSLECLSRWLAASLESLCSQQIWAFTHRLNTSLVSCVLMRRSGVSYRDLKLLEGLTITVQSWTNPQSPSQNPLRLFTTCIIASPQCLSGGYLCLSTLSFFSSPPFTLPFVLLFLNLTANSCLSSSSSFTILLSSNLSSFSIYWNGIGWKLQNKERLREKRLTGSKVLALTIWSLTSSYGIDNHRKDLNLLPPSQFSLLSTATYAASDVAKTDSAPSIASE